MLFLRLGDGEQCFRKLTELLQQSVVLGLQPINQGLHFCDLALGLFYQNLAIFLHEQPDQRLGGDTG